MDYFFFVSSFGILSEEEKSVSFFESIANVFLISDVFFVFSPKIYFVQILIPYERESQLSNFMAIISSAEYFIL